MKRVTLVLVALGMIAWTFGCGSDNGGASNPPVNFPPTALPQSVNMNENSSLMITLSGTDIDSDPLTYSIITSPAHGSLSGTPPAVTYTPDTDYVGMDSFTFKVNDGTDDSNPALVSISVSSVFVNTPPTANDDSLSCNEDDTVSITLTCSDPDPDSLSYTIVSAPLHGVITGTPPTVTYTPNTDWFGSDNFTFRVHDGTEYGNTATVSISVVDTYKWEQLAPYGGFVSSIAFNPNNSTDVWLSGDDGCGIYRRNPSGQWEMQNNIPPDWSSYSIVVDPTDADIVYAPNHFGRGLLKTINGGTTWTVSTSGLPTEPRDAKIVYDLVLDPSDPTTLIMCCGGGVYRSIDSGDTFSKVTSPEFIQTDTMNPIDRFTAAEVIAPNRIILANTYGGVYQSTDGGKTFTTIISASSTGLAITDLAYSGNALYVAYVFGYIWRTETLSSVDYTLVNDITQPGAIISGLWTKMIAVQGATTAQDTLYVGSVYIDGTSEWGFHVSHDGGANFTRSMNGLRGNSIFCIAMDPSDSDHLIVGCINGGVFETTNGAAEWTDISNGIYATDSLGMVQDPSNEDRLLFSSTAGLRGTSKVFESVDSGLSWTIVSSLAQTDVYTLYIDPENTDEVMVGTFKKGLYKSYNGFAGPWVHTLSPVGNFAIADIEQDAVNPDLLYATTDETGHPSESNEGGIYYSDNNGDSWVRKVDWPVIDIKPHPSTSGEAVVASVDVIATTDSFTVNGTMLGLASVAPGESFTSLAFDTDNSNILYVGTHSGKLYKTENYSASGGCIWQEIVTPAVDVYIMDIQIANTGAGKAIYLDAWVGDRWFTPYSTPGILRSLDGGSTWTWLNDGLYPARLVFRLEKGEDTGVVFYARMWGGGLMKLTD